MSASNEKLKRHWASNVEVEPQVLSVGGLRNLAQSEPKAFVHRCQTLIDQGKLRWQDVQRLDSLYSALWDVKVPSRHNIAGQERAITSSAFPLLAGSLTVAGIVAAYEAVPVIGDQLVTEIEDNKKWSHFAELRPESVRNEGVLEGEAFPEVGAGERKYSIGHLKDGLRVSITTEAVEENNVADIIRRIQFLGDYLAKRIEKRTLSRVTDHDGSAASGAEPFSLHVNNAGVALYAATANSPGTETPSGTRLNNNALVDESSLTNARKHLAGYRDSLGERIAVPMSEAFILVPDALIDSALKIVGSELVPGVFNELNPWGPRGQYKPKLLSSPYLDDLSTGAWYFGAFRLQFVRKFKFKMTNVTLGDMTQAYLERDIVFQARVSADVEIGATKFNQVVQCLPGTTAPKDGG
jgi:hypothetical protein